MSERPSDVIHRASRTVESTGRVLESIASRLEQGALARSRAATLVEDAANRCQAAFLEVTRAVGPEDD